MIKRTSLLCVVLSLSFSAIADHHTEIDRAVANEARPEADTERDENRKPGEVLEFFAIESGMKVLDIFAGGGYYSEILSYAVGDMGEVALYNNGGWDGFVGAGVTERLADNRLANVRSVVAETSEVDFAADYYDAAIFVLGFHDLYYADEGWPAIDGAKFLSDIYNSIKPGGVMGIVDHAAESGASIEVANTLHRIDPETIRTDMLNAGFEFDAQSSALRNSEDDRSKPMSDPEIRGKTDRVVYLFRKPG